MTKPRFVLAALTVTLFVADLDAQRRSRRFSRPRQPAAAEPAPAETAKPEKKEIENWLAIEGGDVHIGNGSVLRRATVLIGDDKITAVGHEVEIPEGATRIDATDKVVAPGFCIPKAVGFGTPSSFRAPESIADEVNPFDPTIKLGLAAGITSFLAMYDAGRDVPKGKSAIVKLSFGDLEGMVAVENPVVSMRMPLNAQQFNALRKLVRKARDFRDQADAKPAAKAEAPKAEGNAGNPSGRGRPSEDGKTQGKGDAKAAKPPAGTELLLEIMSGKKRLWIAGVSTTPNLRQALEVAELMGQGVVLDNPTTAWAIADEVAATGSMVLLSPRARVRADPGRPNETGSNIAAARILDEVGVPVAVTLPGGRFGSRPGVSTGGILGQDLNTPTVDAAYAVRGGMDNRKALRTITLDSAKLCGAQARVGSIEVGKDADLLILDGDPLHYKTFVETTLVNGKVVYEKDKEPFYRHITRKR